MSIPVDLPKSSTLEPEFQQQLQQRLRQLAVREGPSIVDQDYTFQDSDTIDSLQVDATAGNITITLPSPTGNRRRRIINVAGGFIVTVASAALINGVSTYLLERRFRYVEVEPTGATWLIVGFGNFNILGNGSIFLGNAVRPTTATNGFAYVPTCAGTPTGVPENLGAYVPIIVDTTNNKLYFYSGGAWRDAGP